MRLEAPSDSDLRDTSKKVEWSVGAPTENLELTEEELNQLENRVHRVKDRSGERGTVLQMLEKRSEKDGELRNFRIDFSLLMKILYEHRRYSLARGFSDAEMDILRSIEFHSQTRVGVDEIMEGNHAKEYSESTVYKALRTLRDKELITKVRPGVYKYIGP